ncbi:hypothetical protein L8N14_015320, partial [Serratia marcescens]|nr:hypothetical protein [Serratia marcescens]
MTEHDSGYEESPLEDVDVVSNPAPASMIRDAIVSSVDHASSFLSEEDRRVHVRAMIENFLSRFVGFDVLPSAEQFA